MCFWWNHLAPFMEPPKHWCCDGAHHEEACWMLEPAPVVAGTIAHGCFEQGTSMRCDDDGRGARRSCNQRQNLLELAAKKATTTCKISYYRQPKSLVLLQRTTGIGSSRRCSDQHCPARSTVRDATTSVPTCYNQGLVML